MGNNGISRNLGGIWAEFFSGIRNAERGIKDTRLENDKNKIRLQYNVQQRNIPEFRRNFGGIYVEIRSGMLTRNQGYKITE